MRTKLAKGRYPNAAVYRPNSCSFTESGFNGGGFSGKGGVEEGQAIFESDNLIFAARGPNVWSDVLPWRSRISKTVNNGPIFSASPDEDRASELRVGLADCVCAPRWLPVHHLFPRTVVHRADSDCYAMLLLDRISILISRRCSKQRQRVDTVEVGMYQSSR